MAYDLLVKNGRLIDGSGMPAFRGDLGIRNGLIVELGKLSGPADRVIDADGLAVSPGFVDNHCHYDAQVTWDPLCTFSCYHGATTVVIGNCSLAVAPVRPGAQDRVCEFLSRVEAIPMEVLRTVDFSWETNAQYMDALDGRIGVNVGTLIGHSAVRYYVMGDESQGRGGHRGRDTGNAAGGERRHPGRGIGPVGVQEHGPLRPPGRAGTRRLGNGG